MPGRYAIAVKNSCGMMGLTNLNVTVPDELLYVTAFMMALKSAVSLALAMIGHTGVEERYCASIQFGPTLAKSMIRMTEYQTSYTVSG